jgi:glycosyltransferase involved in cell wall biosynthesis
MSAVNEYVITILMPTRNRHKWAHQAAMQVLKCPAEDIQLVVQDNSDNNDLECLLKPFASDVRLKYNYSPNALSFVENFGIAMSLADGEYVCIIGDDDGINHEIVELSRWAKSLGLDAILPALSAIYFWPETGLFQKNVRAERGYMSIKKTSAQAWISETRIGLRELLRNGCQNYLSLDLAKVYHGVVKKSRIDYVKQMTGKFFGGLSPDINSAVSLSIAIPKIVCVDYPLTISGMCSKSGSVDSATGKHTGSLADAPHFRGHKNYRWADEVPKYYSVETIWADSALAAVKDMGTHNLLQE